MEYDTLKQLRDAYQAGQIPKSAALAIDNDTVSLYETGENGYKIFEMHPADLLLQALDLLGIPHESV